MGRPRIMVTNAHPFAHSVTGGIHPDSSVQHLVQDHEARLGTSYMYVNARGIHVVPRQSYHGRRREISFALTGPASPAVSVRIQCEVWQSPVSDEPHCELHAFGITQLRPRGSPVVLTWWEDKNQPPSPVWNAVSGTFRDFPRPAWTSSRRSGGVSSLPPLYGAREDTSVPYGINHVSMRRGWQPASLSDWHG